jgi:photosystem II stability/assembly factor-like uncharacterized protein
MIMPSFHSPAIKIRTLLPGAILLGGLLLKSSAILAQNWIQTAAPSTNWWAIASSADGNRLAAIAADKLYLSADAGASWSPSAAPSKGWMSVASSADGTKLFAGTFESSSANPSGIFASFDSGATWTNLLASNDSCFVAASADGARLVAVVTRNPSGPGHVLVSTNSGGSWAYPKAPDGKGFWPSAGGFCAASSADGTHLAVAAAGGNIFTSQDSGLTWTKTSARSGMWLSIASSADGTRLVAATADSGVYVSADSGFTWTVTKLPRYAYWPSVASSSDGRRLAAAALGDNVYASADSGLTWQKANLPDGLWQAVASSADGSKLAAAIYSSTSDGTTFTPGPLYVLHSAAAPALRSVAAGDRALTLSWPLPSENLTLQHATDPNASDWGTVTNPPVLNPTNLEYQVTMPLSGEHAFYRLQAP